MPWSTQHQLSGHSLPQRRIQGGKTEQWRKRAKSKRKALPLSTCSSWISAKTQYLIDLFSIVDWKLMKTFMQSSSVKCWTWSRCSGNPINKNFSRPTAKSTGDSFSLFFVSCFPIVQRPACEWSHTLHVPQDCTRSNAWDTCAWRVGHSVDLLWYVQRTSVTRCCEYINRLRSSRVQSVDRHDARKKLPSCMQGPLVGEILARRPAGLQTIWSHLKRKAKTFNQHEYIRLSTALKTLIQPWGSAFLPNVFSTNVACSRSASRFSIDVSLVLFHCVTIWWCMSMVMYFHHDEQKR